MQVRATDKGYYGLQLKEIGDVFTLKDPADFSGIWMEAVDKKDQKKFARVSQQDMKDQIDASASGLDTKGKPQPHAVEESEGEDQPQEESDVI